MSEQDEKYEKIARLLVTAQEEVEARLAVHGQPPQEHIDHAVLVTMMAAFMGRYARLLEQNTELQDSNSKYLERARKAESALMSYRDRLKSSIKEKSSDLPYQNNLALEYKLRGLDEALDLLDSFLVEK